MKDFLFTLLAWLLTLPFVIGAIVFAIYNSENIAVVLSPFRDALEIPLYVPVLTAIAFGFLFGAIMTWAGMAPLRADRRLLRKRIKELEKKLETSNQNMIPTHNYMPPSTHLISKQ